MKTVGIIAAMSKEARLVEAMLTEVKTFQAGGTRFFSGYLGENQIVLAQCGIGKVCAAAGAVELINRYHPEIIINTGAAGGIAPGLNVMDVIVAERSAYYDVYCGGEPGCVQDFPRFLGSDEKLLDVCKSLNIRCGLIAGGDKFITHEEEVREIKKIYPEALAVDMESAAIAQVCYMYKVPFVSLRVISDTPGVENHAEQYENFWETAGEESFKILKQLLEKLR